MQGLFSLCGGNGADSERIDGKIIHATPFIYSVTNHITIYMYYLCKANKKYCDGK